MKRFYKVVTSRVSNDGHEILLDTRPVKTPARNILSAPNENLANEIIKEWAGQTDSIDPETMPLTQILTTKIDRVNWERKAMEAAVLKYLNTDLLCYRATHPPEVALLQLQAWDPWLQWFEKRFGFSLLVTTELKALEQNPEVQKDIAKLVTNLDPDRFTILQLVTAYSGSLVLALAFLEREISPEVLFAATRVEENYKAALYNEEKYGPDPLQEKKDKALKRDLAAAKRYLDLI